MGKHLDCAVISRSHPVQDFIVSGARDHGVPELVNLLGIESPGLASSLAIADHIAEMLE